MNPRPPSFTKISYSWPILTLLLLSIITMGIAIVEIELIPKKFTSQNWELQIAYISLIWLISYFLCTFLEFKTIYLFTSAYVVSLFLFHLGITVPDAFRIFSDFGWGNGDFCRWLQMSGWYTMLGLSCLGIGFSISLYGKKGEEEILEKSALKTGYWAGIGLFIASMFFLALAFQSWGNLLSYSRVDFFRGGKDTRGFGAFLMTFPSAVLLLCVCATTFKQKLFSYSIGTTATLVLSLSGYRSAVLFPLMVFMVLWKKTGRRVPKGVAISILCGTFLVIPLIGMLRSLGPYKELDKSDFEKAAKAIQLKETFRTLGQTGGLLAHVLRLVPDIDPYRYGTSYLQALRNSIPNIFPKMSKSLRVEAKMKMFTKRKAICSTPPSDWLTYRVARDRFDRGEGVGFTGIGEPYLNFGVGGVVFFFISLGFFLGRLEIKQLLAHPKWLIFAGALYWPMLRTVRNDFSNFIKPAIFMIIILIIWRAFLFIFSFRNPTPR